ncbi:Myosin-1, partial [Frankliniella fusca]
PSPLPRGLYTLVCTLLRKIYFTGRRVEPGTSELRSHHVARWTTGTTREKGPSVPGSFQSHAPSHVKPFPRRLPAGLTAAAVVRARWVRA